MHIHVIYKLLHKYYKIPADNGNWLIQNSSQMYLIVKVRNFIRFSFNKGGDKRPTLVLIGKIR